MRCENARQQLTAGESLEAEAHVAECATCFAALEQQDPLVEVLRAARPQVDTVPATIGPSVLRRWQPVRISWRLGLAAAVAMLTLALALGGALIWLSPGTFARPLAIASNAFDVVSTIVNGILAVPRVLLFDRPAVLAGYIVLVIIACGLWVRLYRSLELQRRQFNR
jgi:hypothetical protein